MGCCEGRDTDHLSLPRSSRSNGHSNRLQEAAKEADSSRTWLQFAEARNKGDIAALVEFLHCSEKAKCRYPQKDEWVPPTSIGGHALSALADLCQERGDEVAKALENDLHRIVEYIDSRSLELQDPSLVLLYHVSPSLSPSLKDRVINIGGFNVLLKVMRSGSKLKRQTAAETCRILYEGSDARKDKFVALDGITTLVHVMNMDRDETDYVHNSLLGLYELTQVRCIQNDQEDEHIPRIHKLNQADVLETIATLDLSSVLFTQVKGETPEMIERLTQILQSERNSSADMSPFN